MPLYSDTHWNDNIRQRRALLQIDGKREADSARSLEFFEVLMPSYDYRCEANGQVIEVQHSMQIKLTTWGELVGLAGLELGDTAADAPVERLITGGGLVSSKALKNALPPCQLGEGCGGCGA